MRITFEKGEYPTIDKVSELLNVSYPNAEVYVSIDNPDADPREKKMWSGDSTVKEMAVYVNEWHDYETGAKGIDVEAYIIPAKLVAPKVAATA